MPALTPTTSSLPMPIDQLPEAVRRFCDPSSPVPARMAAARGLVPLGGHDQIVMLAQLVSDPAEELRRTAAQTLQSVPKTLMVSACQAPLHPAILDFLADYIDTEEATLFVIANPATSDATVERVARTTTERVTERIAVNEQRLLRCPTIIEALYKNRNARMSTADRLVELAARNKLDLTGIPAFQAHVEALQHQLIPEPSADPLPQDLAFAHTLSIDSNEDVFEDSKDDTETVKARFKPLTIAIFDMSKTEKIRLAMVGNMAARALLVRDRDKQVAMAAVTSPQTTAGEAAEIAKSKQVSEEILRFVGSKKEFIKSGEVKHNLVFNPKCPIGVSLKFMGHLRHDELRKLANNRNVAAQVRSLASQWILRKERG